MDKISADEDLRIKLDLNKKYGGGQPAADAILARNILHSELEYFTDKQTDYHFDEYVRDRLIAHARQDAAHAVLGIGTLSKDVSKLRKLGMLIASLLVIVIVLLIANLIR